MQGLPVLLLLPLLRLLQGGLQAGSVVIELPVNPLPLQLQLALREVQLLNQSPAEGLLLLTDLQLLLDVGGPVLAALLPVHQLQQTLLGPAPRTVEVGQLRLQGADLLDTGRPLPPWRGMG